MIPPLKTIFFRLGRARIPSKTPLSEIPTQRERSKTYKYLQCVMRSIKPASEIKVLEIFKMDKSGDSTPISKKPSVGKI